MENSKVFIVCLSAIIPAAILDSTLTSISAFIVVLLFPGYLLLERLDINMSLTEKIIYSLSLSAILTMAITTIYNYVYLALPSLPKPYTTSTVLLLTLSLIGILLLNSELDCSDIDIVLKKEYIVASLLSISIVLAAVIGGNQITTSGNNIILILTITLIGLLPVLIWRSRLPCEIYPLLLYSSSLALLYQNSIILTNLRHGDGMNEFYPINLVLTYGFWDPSFGFTKNSLLSLVSLHSYHSLVLDMPLLWEIKIVRPLFTALIPVLLYEISKEELNEKNALLGAFCYMFLHPYFSLLARNTRTATAILFLLLLVHQIIRQKNRVIIILLLFGVITAHNGVAPLAVALLGFIFISSYIMRHISRSGAVSQVSLPLFLLSVIFTVLWYSRTAVQLNFEYYVYLIDRMVSSIPTILSTFLTSSSSAGRAISTETTSFTYTFIKYEFIVLIAITVLGYIIYMMNLIYEDGIEGIGTFQITTLAAVGLFVFAFIPPATSIARIVAISLAIVTPFAFRFLDTIDEYLSILPNSSSYLPIIMAGLLMINAGVVSALFLHESTPQPNLDREYIEGSNEVKLKYELYGQYTPTSDVYAAEWVKYYQGNQKINGPGTDQAFPSYLFFDKQDRYMPPGDYEVVGESGEFDGYLYLNTRTTATNKFTTSLRPADYSYSNVPSIPIARLELENKSKIYSSNTSSVYASN